MPHPRKRASAPPIAVVQTWTWWDFYGAFPPPGSQYNSVFWFLVLHFFSCLLTWGSNGDTTRCRSLINVDLNSNSRSNPVKCGHRVTCCCWVLDALFKSGLLQSGSNVSTSGLRYAAHHHGNKRPNEFMSLSQRTDLTTTFLPVTVRLCRIYTGVLGYFFPHHSETGVTFKKSAGKISY